MIWRRGGTDGLPHRIALRCRCRSNTCDLYSGAIEAVRGTGRAVRPDHSVGQENVATFESCRRIFVWQDMIGRAEDEVRELLNELRRFGPNLLLWISTVSSFPMAKTVGYLGRGLLYATVPPTMDLSIWHKLYADAASQADRLALYGDWGYQGFEAGASA